MDRSKKIIAVLLMTLLMLSTVAAGLTAPAAAVERVSEQGPAEVTAVVLPSGSASLLDPLLREEIEARPDQRIPVIIAMKEQPGDDIEAAKSLAMRTYRSLRLSLEQIQAENVKQHWIINAISARVPAQRINEIAAHPEVLKVWLDAEVRLIEPVVVPGKVDDYGDALIGAPALWNRGYDGAGILISILDTGIDKRHPDLEGKVILEKDFTDDGTPDDLHGHGTHVAGIAAGKKTARVSGVAPGASLLNAKVLNARGDSQISWIISGIEWSVENQADILNISLGMPQGDGRGRDPFSWAVTNAVNSGVIVVTSAGNSGAGEGTIGSPAVAPGVIAVAASDRNDAIAEFSSRGPAGDGRVGIDLAAPGVAIIAPVPQRVDRDGYAVKSGTSMSAPHVAGAVALLLQALEVPQPAIVSRTEWGCPDGQDSPRLSPQPITVAYIVIHHTDTPNVLPWGPGVNTWSKVVHKIWDIHALNPGEKGRWGVGKHGWGDIGYNYLIDPDGVIYEGRAGGPGTRGGHATNWNHRSAGIAFIGKFCEVKPTEAALRSAERLIAWTSAQKGIDPLGKDDGGIYYISGHSDVGNTLCPGKKLHDLLPAIRQKVSDLLKLKVLPGEIERVLKNAADNIGACILEQGAGRLDVSDALDAWNKGVLVDPPGWFAGKVSPGSIIERTFTITNNAPADIALNIAKSAITDTQGTLGGSSIHLSTDSLTVPAGGNATFTVTISVIPVAVGTYIGRIELHPIGIVIPLSFNAIQHLDDTTPAIITGTVDEGGLLGELLFGDWPGDRIYYALVVPEGIGKLRLELTWTDLLNDLDLYLFDPRGTMTKSEGLFPEEIIYYFPMAGLWTAVIHADILTAPLAYVLKVEAIATRTIYVPDDYPTIQKAVDAANPGDAIIVRAGTYTENVDITRSLVIKSEQGPQLTKVQAANRNDHVFHITADRVIISGFTVMGATADRKVGIGLERVSGCEIVNNISSGNWGGIELSRSYRNIIRQNTFTNNQYGIGITGRATCAVAEAVYRTEITAAPEETLNLLRDLRDETLRDKYVNLFYEYSPEVTRILIEEPRLLLESARLIMKYMPAVRYVIERGGKDLEITEQDVTGVVSFIRQLSNEVGERKERIGIERSSEMITLLHELENEVKAAEGQRFSQAFRTSVYFAGNEKAEPHGNASNIIYLNNFVNNKHNARVEVPISVWNSPKRTYIFRGKEFTGYLGNHWANYAGVDADGDGIGDTPYIIDKKEKDHYPLMEPYENYLNQYPNRPSNLSPADEAPGVSLTPILQSSAFSDPNAGDTHAASQWQITTIRGDYSSPVFDSGRDTENLISITVPRDKLNYSTTYYWRVRHQDNHGAWSEWSAESYFTTVRLAGDATGDGKVDTLDLSTVARSFNTGKGDAGWNPAADLNQDGIVDIFDLIMVGRNFGKLVIGD